MGLKYWVLTDTHLGHRKLEEYENRPPYFEELILKNAGKISTDDVLIHLGDFCIGKDDYWHKIFFSSCNPYKCWLIRGNHDKKSNTWYIEHGWDVVADRIDLNIFGSKIAFSHRKLPHQDLFDINIHGHEHSSVHHDEYVPSDYAKLITIEHKYEPILLRDIIENKT